LRGSRFGAHPWLVPVGSNSSPLPVLTRPTLPSLGTQAPASHGGWRRVGRGGGVLREIYNQEISWKIVHKFSDQEEKSQRSCSFCKVYQTSYRFPTFLHF